jgi:hypothetical protein
LLYKDSAVIAVSGIRVAIGLSGLGAVTFGIHAPAHGFHCDAIRIPMMIAAAASVADFFRLVLFHQPA